MDFNRFTEKLQEAFRTAQSVAAGRGNQQIDVEHLLPGFGGDLPGQPTRADPGVGQHDVDAAELGDPCFEYSTNLREVAHIGLLGNDLATCFLDKPNGLLKILRRSAWIGGGRRLRTDVESRRAADAYCAVIPRTDCAKRVPPEPIRLVAEFLSTTRHGAHSV